MQYRNILKFSHSPSTLGDVVKMLEQSLKPKYYEVQVRRDHVLDDILKEARKKGFQPFKRIKVLSNQILCAL